MATRTPTSRTTARTSTKTAASQTTPSKTTPSKKTPSKKTPSKKTPSDGAKKKQVKLLSGGNPQIAKGDGDAPVQAYLDALPGWKRDVGVWLDDVIMRAVPGVEKAVKWNSPFYGQKGRGWFLNFHMFTNFVRVAFFRGKQLQPPPPGPSKSHDTRYLDVRENDVRDEAQLTAWVKQAAALPGWLVS